MPFGKTNGSDMMLSHEKVCGSVIRDLTQKDGWKTQGGRMTKKCRARPGMHSLARHFFVILPSCVFQPPCCVRSLTATHGHVEQLIGHLRVPLSLSFKASLRRLERVFTSRWDWFRVNAIPRAKVRGFQCASVSSCKQQWRPQLK